MRKTFAVIFALLAASVCLAPRADASTLSFQSFMAGSGVTVSVPYHVGAGTERDPDTVTLTVDTSAPTLTFQLTAVGSGFTGGYYCELDWDDEDRWYGAPRADTYPQLSGGSFSEVQQFSIDPARLNLAAGGARYVRYELDADPEPSGRDVERHLLVTFVPAGSSQNPSAPATPAGPTLSFNNFTAGSGVAVAVPYQAAAGTRYAPDTLTLSVDLTAPALTFQFTVMGSGFSTGPYCELDWDGERYGAPREETIIPISGGGFSAVQSFSLSPASLNRLAAGTPQIVLYELDADEEPYDGLDAERYLQVTFTASGASQTPSNPVIPAGPTLSFNNFTAGSGVTVAVPYQAAAGTRYDPDTLTLSVNLTAPALAFQLTVAGSGFSTGPYCELDWDGERYGAPREETIIPVSGGGFSAVQSFSLSPASLNRLAAGTPQIVLYELDADEEPYDGLDVERYLQVTFTAAGTSQNPVNPNNPTNPTAPGGGNDGGGGGCSATGAGLALLGCLALLPKRK